MNNNTESAPRVAIVGGGLVGALNACFFAQRGWNVDVYEQRADIRNMAHVAGRSINLAMSFRARQALAAVGLEQTVLENGLPMSARFIHEPDGSSFKLPYGKPGQFIVSINRRQLNELMLTEAEKHSKVRLFFGHKLLSVVPETRQMLLRTSSNEQVTHTADLILGCDGAYSSVRRSLMKAPLFNYSQEYIESGYIELNIKPTASDNYAMDPGYFHLWPRGEFCLIALGNRDKTFTVTLFAPFAVFEKQLTDDVSILAFFSRHFPDATSLIGTSNILEIFHTVRPSPLVSIKCSPHHLGSSVLLMGDAAHAMVPFYGQGMNCGFEDCLILHDLLDSYKNDIALVLQKYSEVRVPDAHEICNLAMYNYKELKYLVNSKGFQLRKKVDNFLNIFLPRSWIPLYSMVTFSRIRYSEIVKRRRRQDKVLYWSAIGTLISATAFAAVVIMKRR